ncbi:hypothetical protein MsAg5_12220 [Methanosarcinaceae archaeon Ag5]|uniref:Uncharacterized protein n=1 Tax=Methanolapillus africanus TaxID=3028297 RepID=A0AAE4SDC4_9EURY|nr:hypothetical protein [Methanosarcinaceae archaeon Ag5]
MKVPNLQDTKTLFSIVFIAQAIIFILYFAFVDPTNSGIVLVCFALQFVVAAYLILNGTFFKVHSKTNSYLPPIGIAAFLTITGYLSLSIIFPTAVWISSTKIISWIFSVETYDNSILMYLCFILADAVMLLFFNYLTTHATKGNRSNENQEQAELK